jgi:cytochrome c oxidase assembly protein subunit 16
LTFRYEFSKQSSLKPELAEEYGLSMKKPGEVTLESEFEKIKKVSTI